MSLYSLFYGIIVISMVAPIYAQVYFHVAISMPDSRDGLGSNDWKVYLAQMFWVICCDALVFHLVDAGHLSTPHLIFFLFGGWAPFWLLSTTKKLYHLYHQGPPVTIPALV